MVKPTVYAFIGARAGSKGISHKNIALIGGFSLISYSIVAAKMANIDRVIVSTDSNIIADISEFWGAEVPFIRPREYASDTATDYDWISHAIKALKNDLPDYIAHIRPTTPLRDYHTINRAIKMMQDNPEATSLRSAHRLSESPHKMFVLGDDFESIYFKPYVENADTNAPRQNFKPVFQPNGYIDILKTEHIIKNKNLHGNKILAFETHKVIEVDSPEDLQELQHAYERHPLYLEMLKIKMGGLNN